MEASVDIANEISVSGLQTGSSRLHRWIDVALGSIIGLLGWRVLGFNHTLNPHHIDWFFYYADKEPYYDPVTYFLGWNYFRHSPWTLPLGLNRSYGMEVGSSIVYSDSTPLLAVLLKPFSPLMGPVFQYCGLWILSCFLLQGVMGIKLASVFVRNNLSKIVITAFFVLSPVLLERGSTEYAHMGQWVVLLAIYLNLRGSGGKVRWVWMVLVALAVGTSFYYVPMVLLLWMADGLRRWFAGRRSFGRVALEGGGMLVSLLFTMWILGYFAVAVSNASTDDFGKCGTNLLGLIDPWGASLILRDQPKSPFWLGEGYCYLGAGMILLGTMAVFNLIRMPLRCQQLIRIAPLAAVMLGLVAFSLTNKIAFGAHVLVLPNIWGPLGAIFRASGRMIWPAYYGLWLAFFFLVCRNLNSRRAAVILSVMLLLQIVDLSPSYLAMRLRNSTHLTWRTPLTDPFWAKAMKTYRQISVVPTGAPLPYAPLALLGSNNGVPCNGASVARYPAGSVLGPISNHRIQTLLDNNPNKNILYVIPESDRFAELIQHLGKMHGVGTINGYNVIAPYWFVDGHAPSGDGLVPGPNALVSPR
jgi:hypothetical protein